MAKTTPEIELPELDTSAGMFFCLHLPVGHHEQMPVLERHILQRAGNRCQKSTIARPATRDRSLLNLFRHQPTVNWLMNRGMSREEASATKDSLGVRVHELLGYNAGDPRSLLGIAAAIEENPDVLIYSTCGMSPVGRIAAHHFVDRHRATRCAVHISPAPISISCDGGTKQQRFCPASANCILLSAT